MIPDVAYILRATTTGAEELRLSVSTDPLALKSALQSFADSYNKLNEALAAGLLLLTEWDRQSPLCDPMCGSATFLIEAAFLAQDRAPGLGRAFAFERWSDLDLDRWKQLFADAEQRLAAGAARALPPLLGNDRHPGAADRGIVSQAPELLGGAAVHALRVVPANVPDVRSHEAGAEQSARADCPDAGHRG